MAAYNGRKRQIPYLLAFLLKNLHLYTDKFYTCLTAFLLNKFYTLLRFRWIRLLKTFEQGFVGNLEFDPRSRSYRSPKLGSRAFGTPKPMFKHLLFQTVGIDQNISNFSNYDKIVIEFSFLFNESHSTKLDLGADRPKSFICFPSLMKQCQCNLNQAL